MRHRPAPRSIVNPHIGLFPCTKKPSSTAGTWSVFALQAQTMQVRLLWDFRGPDAEQTAKHFEEHLREFFQEHDLEMPSGTSPAEGSVWSAFCDPPDLPGALEEAESGHAPANEPVADRVGRALRPSRVEVS